MKITHRRDLWKVLDVNGDASEIGVAEGYFSAEMLNWWDHYYFPKVYMVDRWKSVPSQKGDASQGQAWHDSNLAKARERVWKYGYRAVFLQGNSTDMVEQVPDKSLALLYIDADHSFQGVMGDLMAWTPKVMPGGIVALHDYEAPQYGVNRAVQAFCEGSFTIELLPEDKPEDAGCYFRIC